jgi:hypothetical protein
VVRQQNRKNRKNISAYRRDAARSISRSRIHVLVNPNVCHLDRSRSHAQRDEAQWRDPEGRSLTIRLGGFSVMLLIENVARRRLLAEVPADGMVAQAPSGSLHSAGPALAEPAAVEMTALQTFRAKTAFVFSANSGRRALPRSWWNLRRDSHF